MAQAPDMVEIPQPSRGKVARNAVHLLAGQVVMLALSMLLSASLARWLGAEEFGNYFLLMTAVGFAGVIVEWGQSAYLVREAARRPDDVGPLLAGAVLYRVIVCALSTVAIAIVFRLMGHDARLQQLALLAGFCSLPMLIALAYSYAFRSRDRMDLDAAVNVASKAATVGVTLAILAMGFGLAGVLQAQALGGLAGLVAAIVVAKRLGIRLARPDWAICRELLIGGAPIAAFFVATSVQPFVDALVLAALAPAYVVGCYGAARSILNLLCVPAQILGTASFPELSRLAHTIPEMRRTLASSLRILLGIGVLAGAGTFLFADVAIHIVFGAKFDPAIVLLQLWAPALPLFFLDSLFGVTLTALGKTQQIASVKVMSIVVSTALAIALIPYFQNAFGNGGIGLALALACSELIMLAAFLWLLPRGLLGASAIVDVLRAVVAGCATTAIVHYAFGGQAPWVAIPVTIVLFALLCAVTGLFKVQELNALIRVLKRGA
mgnify:CR=1 FL=1